MKRKNVDADVDVINNKDRKITKTLFSIDTISDLIDICKDRHKYKSFSRNNNNDICHLSYILKELEEINKMVGLYDLKKQLTQMILYTLQYPYDTDMLHICIDSEPGTGKTTISSFAERKTTIFAE